MCVRIKSIRRENRKWERNEEEEGERVDNRLDEITWEQKTMKRMMVMMLVSDCVD